MKQKQKSIDFFFSLAKDTKKVQPKENLAKEEKKEAPLIDDNIIPEILSRSSSPLPISTSETFELDVHSNKEEKEIINEDRPKEEEKEAIHEEKVDNILIPEWEVSNNKSEEFLKTENSSENKEELYDDKKERNIHWELEIIEHRIQFGKDLDHPHPAMAPDVLVNEGLTDVHPREKSRLKRYEQIKCKEYIPDFWTSRCWDKDCNKLNRAQSEFLLQSIIEAPFKEKKESDDDTPSDYYSYSSSPVTSDSSSDDESDNTKTKSSSRKTRVRIGFDSSKDIKKTIIKKALSLRLSSLYFDTDNECDTDLEDF